VEWPEGFALILLFSSDHAVTEIFRERLADLFRFRVAPLHVLVPGSAEQVLETLARLASWPADDGAGRSPIWLDLAQQRGEGWEEARRNFLKRLNEKRDRVRQHLARPLVLVLPASCRDEIALLAPDLWSIREYSVDLEDARVPPGAVPPVPSLEHLPTSRSVVGSSEDPVVQEWNRLASEKAEGRGVIFTGWRAVDTLLALKDPEAAAEIAKEVLRQARRLHASATPRRPFATSASPSKAS
jgi:hypothetical protein